ncbi:MAG: bifunctional DNA-formamidopyrimidine glycosylase/DNA-(apurinic or apyrimidinic site) lyase [Gammaproteobacteria bacterium]
MPELPEVETTRRGIEPHVAGQRVQAVLVRDARLRWPVPAALGESLAGQRIDTVRRRAKYLLFDTAAGSLILHLGMSGSLRLVGEGVPPGPHDHLDIVLGDGRALRLRDPRRFGSVHWSVDPTAHPLLRSLGPEPHDPAFDGRWLRARAHGRRQAVKSFIMDGHVVVGVGNIYASEALFGAGIHPHRPAGRISAGRHAALAAAIVRVLDAAIEAGGTTLRDFVGGTGEPGYFAVQLSVYDRAGQPCIRCGTIIRRAVTGQRATFFCPRCQR